MSSAELGKLAVGSAQFGMRYGIAGAAERPSTEVVHDILKSAASVGVFMVDTAHAYGNAETVLGRLLKDDDRFRFTTKTLPLHVTRISRVDADRAARAFEESLDRLMLSRVHGLLVHHADDLLNPGGAMIWDWMQAIQHDGLVERIGVSVYTPDKLKAVLDRYQVQIVQLPYSIYDQRFARGGLLDTLKTKGIEVHSRSTFLQGLLLMDSGQLPDQFVAIRPHQARLHAWLRDHGMTPLAGAIAFCIHDPRTDFLVVGCDNTRQFEDIVDSVKNLQPCPSLEQFALYDEDIIDPSRWSQ